MCILQSSPTPARCAATHTGPLPGVLFLCLSVCLSSRAQSYSCRAW